MHHAGVKPLGGGFAGVDVFFVISGYLITRYIDHRIQNREFSLVEFYERRVRRIVPALLVLLLFASAASFFLLFPRDLYRFAESLVATVLFVPNILFSKEAGYFDVAAATKPLLHTWSLGVEEQFYICFPIAIWIVSRWGRRATTLIVCFAAIVSFALSMYGVARRPDAAFYLPHFRAWELLLGALIALPAIPSVAHTGVRNLLSAAGLIAVITCFFFYTPATPFPGLAAAVPCLGTALVIYANEVSPTITVPLLSFRPLVAIGLISYSLYLWHWPLLVFSQQYLGRPLRAWEATLVVLAAIAMAALSWKFVEQPFRKRTVGATRPSLFRNSAMAAAFLLGLAVAAIVERGFPRRLPPEALIYAEGKQDQDRDLARCINIPIARIEQGNLCRLGSSAARPAFIVWGDSQAAAIAPAFQALANQAGTSGWLASSSGCAPLLGVERVDRESGVSRCQAYNDAVASVIEKYDIHAVFLVARWQVNAQGRSDQEFAEGRRQVYIRDSESAGPLSLAGNMAVFERGLRRTLARMSPHGRNIVTVLDVPNTTVDTPYFLAKASLHGAGPEVTIQTTAYDEKGKPVDALLLRLAGEWRAVPVQPRLFLCHESRCMISKQGRSLYRDAHHLSKYGALQLVDFLRPVFQNSAIEHSFER